MGPGDVQTTDEGSTAGRVIRSLTVLGMNVLADGLNEALNPRLFARTQTR